MNELPHSIKSNLKQFAKIVKDVSYNHLKNISIKVHDSAMNMRNRPGIASKVNNAVDWYEKVTGLDEVKYLQNRVIESQDKFASAQEQRRQISRQLATLHAELKDIYSELETTMRGEERYVRLITKEHELLKKERKINQDFTMKEAEERECFTLMSSFLKESHEKERAQAERTKYWSIIGSIVGTLIGLGGSTIVSHIRMREFRNMLKEASHESNAAAITNFSLFGSTEGLTKILSRLSIIEDQLAASPKTISSLEKSVKALSSQVEKLNKSVEKPKYSYPLNSESNISREDIIISAVACFMAVKIFLYFFSGNG